MRTARPKGLILMAKSGALPAIRLENGAASPAKRAKNSKYKKQDLLQSFARMFSIEC
jgi:hypothetical protein